MATRLANSPTTRSRRLVLPRYDHRKAIERLIMNLDVNPGGVEHRCERRFHYPRLLVVEPLDDLGQVVGDRLTVVGKQLSLSGLSFFHPESIPYRWVAAELEGQGAQSVRLLMDLTWCRFTPHGWYESGGKILAALNPVE